MATEVERKFLVRSDAWRAAVEAVVSIRQFYLAAAPDRSIRIRIRDGREAALTLKFGAGTYERQEFEYPVPLADAEAMQAFAIGRAIEKARHHVRHQGRLFEVDVFAGALAGLVMAELETPETVADAELPPWLGREVTGDRSYLNASLALSDSIAAVA
jgi:adenylate cyclase